MKTEGIFSCNYSVWEYHKSSEAMSMYQVKPISGGDIKIDLPTCMYKLPNIHAQPDSGSCIDNVLQVN